MGPEPPSAVFKSYTWLLLPCFGDRDLHLDVIQVEHYSSSLSVQNVILKLIICKRKHFPSSPQYPASNLKQACSSVVQWGGRILTRPHSNVWVFTFYREYVRSYLPRHHPQVLLQGRRGFPAGPDLPPPVLRPHPAPPHSMVWFQHCAEEIGTGRFTLILNVQNFGSVFLRSNFWYQRNLRCYWQSQMLHRKIRITLASEVFHKKILCFAKASEVFEGIVIFLLNVPHVFWYFQTKKEKVIDTVCLTSPCYNQLCRIISSIKMDCVCNMCSKRFPNQE